MLYRSLMVAVLATAAWTNMARADGKDYEHSPEAQDFIHGEPEVPSETWMRAAGGRIYDNWWVALDREEPEGTHPSYPTGVNDTQAGPGTWRCKECHGWDYRGADGIYSKGSHYTGIPGIRGAQGRPVEEIAATLRDATHLYTQEMITDAEMMRIATFVSRGQVDMTAFLDYETRTVNAGDLERGRAIFQTVCAACHGFDGRLLDWGDGDDSAYVGTEAVEVPDEVFNKIYNAHPGVQMVNLRAFPVEDAVSVLSYAATLPIADMD